MIFFHFSELIKRNVENVYDTTTQTQASKMPDLTLPEDWQLDCKKEKGWLNIMTSMYDVGWTFVTWLVSVCASAVHQAKKVIWIVNGVVADEHDDDESRSLWYDMKEIYTRVLKYQKVGCWYDYCSRWVERWFGWCWR